MEGNAPSPGPALSALSMQLGQRQGLRQPELAFGKNHSHQDKNTYLLSAALLIPRTHMVTWVAWQKAALNLSHTCIVSPVLMFVPVLPPPLERNSVGPCSVSGVLKDSSGSHPGPDAHGHHPVGPREARLCWLGEGTKGKVLPTELSTDLWACGAPRLPAEGHTQDGKYSLAPRENRGHGPVSSVQSTHAYVPPAQRPQLTSSHDASAH